MQPLRRCSGSVLPQSEPSFSLVVSSLAVKNRGWEIIKNKHKRMQPYCVPIA